MDELSAWSQVGPLVGVVIGALLGGGAQILNDWLKHKRERRLALHAVVTDFVKTYQLAAANLSLMPVHTKVMHGRPMQSEDIARATDELKDFLINFGQLNAVGSTLGLMREDLRPLIAPIIASLDNGEDGDDTARAAATAKAGKALRALIDAVR